MYRNSTLFHSLDGLFFCFKYVLSVFVIFKFKIAKRKKNLFYHLHWTLMKRNALAS